MAYGVPQFGVPNNMCCPTMERRFCGEMPGTSCSISVLRQAPLDLSRDLTSKNYVTKGQKVAKAMMMYKLILQDFCLLIKAFGLV